MTAVMLAIQVGKRLGLAKPIARLFFRRLRSTAQKAKAFDDYEPSRHDVFVATFGKSGTNWMMQIAQQVAHRGAAEFDHIHDVAAWPDSPGPGPIPLDDPGPLSASPTGLRVIKTHLETQYVPYTAAAKYLTVLRDPKEVLVSSYYFLGGVTGLLSHLSIEDWWDLASASGGLLESWAVHTASFWDWRDRPNVLVMNYGQIKKEPRKSIEQVAHTMGVDLSETELNRVIQRSSFEYMSAHESQFAPPQNPFGDQSNPTRMVRRGASGESQELLSRARQAEVDRRCQAELRKIGSDFPYATEFEVVES